MALPTNLAAKIKAIPIDPTVISTNLELAYLLSFSQHSNHHTTQPSPMTPFTSTPDNHINHHSKIISSPTSINQLTLNSWSKLLKIIDSKTNK